MVAFLKNWVVHFHPLVSITDFEVYKDSADDSDVTK